jgi:putative CocE/NonD family hydrolase
MRPKTMLLLMLLTFAAEDFRQCLQAQPPDPGKYSAAEHKLVEFRNQMVPMRDGVKLAIDIFRPEGEGRFPAVLCQTPYNKNGGASRSRWLAARGYAVVVSDSRGRFESEGAWDPFDPKHKTDGYDLVEWLARQPWSTGKVGSWGLSYMGWTQWWTATQSPPSLVTIVPEVAPPDQFRNLPYQEGVLFGCMMDWASSNAGRKTIVVGAGGYGGFSTTRAEDFMRTPYIHADAHREVKNAPWFHTWIRENLSTAPYWKAISYQSKESYAKVKVPSLALSGWFDADFPGTPMNYAGMKQHGGTPEARRPRLVIGPWAHTGRGRKLAGFDYGPTAAIDWDGYICRWFDYHLKGIQNGVLGDPPVHVFVMGRNRWRAESDWPLPQTQWTKYFIHSGGKANSSAGDGTLSTTTPDNEPPDQFRYDPLHPTRSAFKGPHVDGAVDTREFSTGQDLLVYTAPPLAEEIEIIGPITAKLYAATSARDTDWMVRLIDVHPDGYAALLCDGVLRARCRDPERGGAFNSAKLSQIEPGKVYEYLIEFWRATGNVFLKGHRIRIEISSSYYPFYLRNLNTGADNVGLETKQVTAHQTIYHDKARPSHIVLPVIPAASNLPSAIY